MITNFQDLLLAIGHLLGSLLLPIVVGVGFLVFLWGIVIFIRHSDNEESVKEGKSKMLWGIIILFVMVSVWSIVGFLQKALFGGDTPYAIPTNSPRTLTPSG